MASSNVALRIRTTDWELVLRTRTDPGGQRAGLENLLRKSGKGSDLKARVEVNGTQFEPDPSHDRPGVFENTIYTLTLRPLGDASTETVRHPFLSEIEESLEQFGGAWHGTIKTGNDLGWFPLEIEVKDAAGRTRVDRVAWQVWPLKLDLATDLRDITQAIEDTYPLWLFRFQTPTVQDAGRKRQPTDPFLLLWFAQFQSRWKELERGIKIVVRNPHVRLEGHSSRRRADRLKGKISPRLEEAVATGRAFPERRYQTKEFRSSLDTVENQFVRDVLDRCVTGLERFRSAVDRPGVSRTFLGKLQGWARSVASYRSAAVFRGLSEFNGMTAESLVLQHRAGYSAVYRSWVQLRHNLEFFAHVSSAQIGMRTISELYEIWCFLEVRRLLVELGFDEQDSSGPRWNHVGLERNLENGQGAAFVLRRKDLTGPLIRLSHEPVFFREKKSESYRSYSVAQRPDIVLEATWDATDVNPGRTLLWIFDAKYRLKTASDDWGRDESRSGQSEYLAPPDALDQMHRYRDAIIHNLQEEKTRPVVSAFALYPGVFDQTQEPTTNPYSESIEAVGIGAFPLIPGDHGGLWLKAFLKQTLGPEPTPTAEDLIHRPNAKIPVSGLVYREEEDLLVIRLDRLVDEQERAAVMEPREGVIHLPSDLHLNVQRSKQVRWLAFAGRHDESSSWRVSFVWYLSDGLPGAGATLHLSRPLQLRKTISMTGPGGHWFRYADVTPYLAETEE